MMHFRELVFVGIDPHKSQHTAVMLDHWDSELFQAQFPNNPSGYTEFLEKAKAAIPDGFTAIFGIEDTGGLGRPLAQWLTTQGHLVKGVNPNLSSDQRRRRPHPDKTDPIDAKAVAQVLMKNLDSLPTVVEDTEYQALREGSRRRDQLIRDRTRCKNQLHVLLHAHYPDYKKLFSDPFGKAALAFWSEYPHPNLLQNVDSQQLDALLRSQARSISLGRAEFILGLADKSAVITPEAKMRITIIKQLIDELHRINDDIAEIEILLKDALDGTETHLETMPGINIALAAKLVGRIGLNHENGSSDKLARYCGIAPEEHGSGGKGRHRRSKSGDRQLNTAFHMIALTQVSVNRSGTPICPVAYSYYQRKIKEGKSKLSALACLKRRLCDIVFAMIRDRSEYLPPKAKDGVPALSNAA